ncbi:unnamed protein product [Trichogramma brassicae]|uniref:Uncharacterized protein n=1 Tax=Trichogramma brassicae TaxID=86971 RepID=A0A6H5J545_9HYME|nr:unnamed protein product [Trichogramma brassicae]
MKTSRKRQFKYVDILGRLASAPFPREPFSPFLAARAPPWPPSPSGDDRPRSPASQRPIYARRHQQSLTSGQLELQFLQLTHLSANRLEFLHVSDDAPFERQ